MSKVSWGHSRDQLIDALFRKLYFSTKELFELNFGEFGTFMMYEYDAFMLLLSKSQEPVLHFVRLIRIFMLLFKHFLKV